MRAHNRRAPTYAVEEVEFRDESGLARPLGFDLRLDLDLAVMPTDPVSKFLADPSLPSANGLDPTLDEALEPLDVFRFEAGDGVDEAVEVERDGGEVRGGREGGEDERALAAVGLGAEVERDRFGAAGLAALEDDDDAAARGTRVALACIAEGGLFEGEFPVAASGGGRGGGGGGGEGPVDVVLYAEVVGEERIDLRGRQDDGLVAGCGVRGRERRRVDEQLWRRRTRRRRRRRTRRQAREQHEQQRRQARGAQRTCRAS